MKKLFKVSVLLAAVIALSACTNTANMLPEDVYVPALPTLLTDSEAASLTVTPELSDFTNGSWTFQSYEICTNYKQYYSGWDKSFYEKTVKEVLTEEELKELESWKATPNLAQNETDLTFYNFPFKKRLYSKTYSLIKLKNDPTDVNAFKVNTIVTIDRIYTTNPVYIKILKDIENYIFENEIATHYYNGSSPEGFIPELKNFSNIPWKANSDKTKFYAESDTVKYYLIKNN